MVLPAWSGNPQIYNEHKNDAKMERECSRGTEWKQTQTLAMCNPPRLFSTDKAPLTVVS